MFYLQYCLLVLVILLHIPQFSASFNSDFSSDYLRISALIIMHSDKEINVKKNLQSDIMEREGYTCFKQN